MKDVYKSEVLAVVLQQLEDRPTLPQLFMSTALKTLTAYKSLASFTNKILLNLVRRRIWTDEKQWSEYIRLCTVIFRIFSPLLSENLDSVLQCFVDWIPGIAVRPFISTKRTRC